MGDPTYTGAAVRFDAARAKLAKAETEDERVREHFLRGVGAVLTKEPAGTRAKPSQATRLIAQAETAELWHTPNGDTYATIPVGDHLEHRPLRAKAFKHWLAQRYYMDTKGAPSAQALHDALSVLEARAQFEGAEHAVHVRLAEHNGTIYLDLCTERWEAVAIDATGWRVTAAPPVRFRRARGMLPLPMPAAGGDIAELARYLNLDPKRPGDWHLLVAWLLASLRPSGPYPVLILHGEQGSGKSSHVRILRSLLDPNTSPLRSAPRDARDLMIAAANGWCLAFDNLSRLEPWLSDALCRLATGGGLSTRELYTDTEEVLLEAQRPVLLNGIEELATRGDLLDRTIIIYLPTIAENKRRTEAQLQRDLDEARPRLLGALLTAVSGAMHELPNVKIDRLPRLADFAVWATAAEEALGWTKGTIMAAYSGNREAANELTLEASPIVAPLRAFMEKPTNVFPWAGTASELLAILEQHVDDQARRLKSWPLTPRALSNALRRLAPNLRAAGVEVAWLRAAHTRRRLVQVDWVGNSSSPPSPSSPNGCGGADVGSAGDDAQESATARVRAQPGENPVVGDDGDARFPVRSGEALDLDYD